jgi:hypothetical protein
VQLASVSEREKNTQHVARRMETPPENAQQEVSLTVTGQFFLRPPHLLIIIAKMQQHCAVRLLLVGFFLPSGSKGDLFCVFLVFCCAPVAAWKTNGKRVCPLRAWRLMVQCAGEWYNETQNPLIEQIFQGFCLYVGRVREAKANRPRCGS